MGTDIIKKENQLRISFESWLHRNHLESDCIIFTKTEWQSRNEKYCNDADLVIVTEGDLCTLLNYRLDEILISDLDDLFESFGYYYELGQHWNLGLYPTDENMECLSHTSYSAKLRDERWQKKRVKILERTKGLCQDCKKEFEKLEVHHCYYMTLCLPWQYPLDSLRALCRDCHEKRAVSEMRLNALLARVGRQKIDELYIQLRNQIERPDEQNYSD